MKKVLVVVFLFLSMTLFANTLMIYDLSDPIYDEIEDLYIIEGKASPIGAKPWTDVDVRHLLDRIDPETETGKALKDGLLTRIRGSENEAKFDFSVSFAPYFGIHSSKDTNYIAALDDFNSTLFDMGIGFYYSDNVALFMNVSLGAEPTDLINLQFRPAASENENGLIIDEVNAKYNPSGENYISNIPYLPRSFDALNFPNRFYAAFGNDFFRVFAGRSRAELGNGVMGNILIGDTLPYHDMLSLTFTGSKWFHYQMLVDFYTPFSNFDKGSDRDPLEGIRFLLAHRFEFSLFSGKLLFALQDSVMYYSDSMYIDPRVLSPMFFLHNAFIAGNSNSLATLEVEYAPVKNFSIYAQLGIDDLAMPNEPHPPEKGATANSIALMGGMRMRYPFQDGYFHGNLEIVGTSPFMYHRATGNGKAGGYDFSFVSSLRYNSGGIPGIFRYLSFPFGSDSIAGQLSFGYKKPGLFDTNMSLFILADGVIDMFSITRWFSGSECANNGFPSTSNPFDENEKGEVEYTFSLGFDAEYTPLSWLELTGGLYFVYVANIDNKTADAFDVQLSMGVRFSY